MSNLLVFDLDGVITGEDAYWDTAGLVVHELLYSPCYWYVDRHIEVYQPVTTAEESRRVSRNVLPETVIVSLKSRSVNSNWDTCYAGFCMYFVYLLSLLPDVSSLFPLKPADDEWIAAFRSRIEELPGEPVFDGRVFQALDSVVFEGVSGLDVLQRFNIYASTVLNHPVEGVFGRYSPSWWLCERLFQAWYLGDSLYMEKYGREPEQRGKPGCIAYEQPLLPVEQLREMVETLHEDGYRLGIATGRPREEALLPLENYGLLPYFDARHITTHAEIARAEVELQGMGKNRSLVKPHPYQFLLAANPEYRFIDEEQEGWGQEAFVVVGDTPSDVNGGHAAGAVVVAVKTGARTAQSLSLLEQSRPDFLLEDVRGLPTLLRQVDSLAMIQRMQFSEREKAERLLRWWFARHMHLVAERVMLTPKAVSLNSFNGFYWMYGKEYFFKTHVEEQGTLEEYYHAELLREAGYNIVRPIRTLHEQGQQMVIYPVVDWPVMFDLMRAVETGQVSDVLMESIIEAEERECERLLAIYEETQAISTAEEQAQAPIHQLFWHRLAGGRYKQFYEGKEVRFPSGSESISFEQLLTCRWRINGIECSLSLGELVERALQVLHPVRAGVTVVGHGDAHFGNVFLEEKSKYLYFDPAFAGRHSPLLDVIKPIFHNVFATWMYFPFEVDRAIQVTVERRDTMLVVEHTFGLTPVREAILRVKEEQLLRPLLTRLGSRCPDEWLAMMQSALMCCPLLTMNLLDRERMPDSIGWLGFAFAVLMGNHGMQSWKLRA